MILIGQRNFSTTKSEQVAGKKGARSEQQETRREQQARKRKPLSSAMRVEATARATSSSSSR